MKDETQKPDVDWESRYQAGDTPWEKGAPSPGLVDYLKDYGALKGRILVPGCGSGHDVRAIATPENAVTGIDIAPSAIERAGTYPKSAHEYYRLADLFDLPPELRGIFDWVWEHTCFCAIDKGMREDYVRGVAEALKPGGHLLAIFYIEPKDEDEGPPHGVSLTELNALFLEKFELLEEWLPANTYEGREGREWMRLMKKR